VDILDNKLVALCDWLLGASEGRPLNTGGDSLTAGEYLDAFTLRTGS